MHSELRDSILFQSSLRIPTFSLCKNPGNVCLVVFFKNPTPWLIIFQMQKAQKVVSGFLEGILEKYINNVKH